MKILSIKFFLAHFSKKENKKIQLLNIRLLEDFRVLTFSFDVTVMSTLQEPKQNKIEIELEIQLFPVALEEVLET